VDIVETRFGGDSEPLPVEQILMENHLLTQHTTTTMQATPSTSTTNDPLALLTEDKVSIIIFIG